MKIKNICSSKSIIKKSEEATHRLKRKQLRKQSTEDSSPAYENNDQSVEKIKTTESFK